MRRPNEDGSRRWGWEGGGGWLQQRQRQRLRAGFSVADFHLDKFMQMGLQYGNKTWQPAEWGLGTGDGVVLGGQLKPGWLYDISGVPRLGDNAVVIRSAPGYGVQKKELPSKPESGLEPLFIVALQRIATCGINYAAIMSCFVAQIFGFAFFMKVSE